ncbi:MAG: BolA family protein [Candidatus Methylumidiphilus sp.]
MDSADIQSAIEQAIPSAQVFLEGEGCEFTAIVISESFAGLSLVKRQQMVLATVSDWLASGALHAFSVKAYTKTEWEDRQAAAAGGLVQIQL